MLYVNFIVKHLKCVPKWPLFLFKPILAATFVTIATVKVKLISDFYAWAIVLINQKEEIGEKATFIVLPHRGGGGGQNGLLMHIALLSVCLVDHSLTVFFSVLLTNLKNQSSSVIRDLYYDIRGNKYTIGCPPVRGDNPRALYHQYQCRPCTPRDISC